MKMKFSDGVEIEVDGPLRIITLHDGPYVVGQGMLCPVDSERDGNTLIKLMQSYKLKVPPCPCECNSGGFCGGCGHAGCGGRR
jgi:hypothetical protein